MKITLRKIKIKFKNNTNKKLTLANKDFKYNSYNTL